jgi:hypothetical protein
MLRMTRSANLTPPNWDKAPGSQIHSTHPPIVARYLRMYGKSLGFSTEEPFGEITRFYTSQGLDGVNRGLMRYSTVGDEIRYDLWDGNGWIDWPPLFGITGIGGGPDFDEITREEAEKLAPEAFQTGEKFYSEDEPRDDHGRWTSGGESSDRLGSISAADHVASLREAIPGTPSHATGEVPIAGTHEGELYKYAMKLDRIEENAAMHTADAARLGALVKQYGPDKVAMAIYAQKFLTGDTLRAAEDSLRNATGPGADLYREFYKTAAPVGTPIQTDTARLAFALDHGWTAKECSANWYAAQSYSGNDYKAINGVMRGTADYSHEANAAALAVGRQFDALLAQAPEIERGADIYRAVRVKNNSDIAKALNTVGGTYNEKGFLSASTSKLFCDNWAKARIEPGDGKQVFVLNWKHEGGARNVMPFLQLGTTEGELTYRPGAKMEVLGVTRHASGITRVRVRVKP